MALGLSGFGRISLRQVLPQEHNGKHGDTGQKWEQAHVGQAQGLEEFLALEKVGKGPWCFLVQPEQRSCRYPDSFGRPLGLDWDLDFSPKSQKVKS